MSDAESSDLAGGATLFPCAKQAAIVVERSARGGDGGGLSGVRRLCSSLVAAFDRNERFLKPSGGMHATKPGATNTTRNFDEDAVREATQLL